MGIDDVRSKFLDDLLQVIVAQEWQPAFRPERIRTRPHANQSNSVVMVLIRLSSIACGDQRDLVTSRNHRARHLLHNDGHAANDRRVAMAKHEDAHDPPRSR